jgi:hypothetical protein
MASDYGLNFGFRRSDESLRNSEGRFRTPAGEDGIILLGTCVEIDPDNFGFVRVGAADVPARPGICGLLVQEEIMFRSLYEHAALDSFQVNYSQPNKLSVITNGPGAKVWFQNTPQQNRADGRVISAVTIVDLDGVSIGTGLVWNGSEWAAGTGDGVHMEVTEVNADAGYCEATLLR